MTTRHAAASITLALLLAGAPAAKSAEAAAEPYSPKFAACMDQSGGVTVGMLDCIAGETATQDVRLNAAYKTLGAQLTPARKTQLQAAQRLWLQYRKANCGFYADPDGGSIAGVAANDCVLAATASRARELETFIEPAE